MKIANVKTYVLQAILENQGFGWSHRVTDRRQTAICVVTTDEGITGLGEAFYFGGPASLAADMIDNALGPLTVGRDPLDTGVIWDFLYNLTRDQGMKGLTISALSAVDIALRDGVTVEKFKMKNGYLDIPNRPGLGVTLDPAFVEKHRL